MELDQETLDQLKGHGFTFTDSSQMRTFRRVGRAPRYIPEFAFDDQMLRSVILHCSLNYVFRGSRLPETFVVDLKHIDQLARDKAAHLKAIADGSEKEYWQRTMDYLDAADRIGYVQMIGAIAWRSWRNVPPWHTPDVAASLAMKPRTVNDILIRLKRTALLMGYPVCAPRKSQQPKVSDDAILDLASLPVSTICERLHTHPERVRTLLRQRGQYHAGLRKHPRRYEHKLKIPADVADQILALWFQGLGTVKIAAAVGRSHPSVVRLLKRNGVYERRRTVTAHGQFSEVQDADLRSTAV